MMEIYGVILVLGGFALFIIGLKHSYKASEEYLRNGINNWQSTAESAAAMGLGCLLMFIGWGLL